MDVNCNPVMGRDTRNAKKVYKCKICKKDFGSYKLNCRENLSHRSHRLKSAFCLREQRRLREEYRAAGNTDEINFDLWLDDDEETAEIQEHMEEEVDDDVGNSGHSTNEDELLYVDRMNENRIEVLELDSDDEFAQLQPERRRERFGRRR